MNLGKAFAKIFYKEASKVVDQRAKQRAKDKHAQKLQTEYAEKHRQNALIKNQKVIFLQEKIDLAEDYLRNAVNVLSMFETKKKLIDSWFYQNHWLKTIDERKVPANYGEMKMTTVQKRELLSRLQLKKEQYVPHGILNDLTEDSTLEFIIENTPVIKELEIIQDRQGYRLYIANHYNDYSRRETTICFGLVVKDDAKQPFL